MWTPLQYGFSLSISNCEPRVVVERLLLTLHRQDEVSELLRDQSVDRAVTGEIGTAYFEHPHSARGARWLPRGVLSL